MELTVRSLQGSYIVSGVESEATLADLKRMLHQQHQQQVPEPEEQCLVSALCTAVLLSRSRCLHVQDACRLQIAVA
jgi:hypothetical protein